MLIASVSTPWLQDCTSSHGMKLYSVFCTCNLFDKKAGKNKKPAALSPTHRLSVNSLVVRTVLHLVAVVVLQHLSVVADALDEDVLAAAVECGNLQQRITA